VHTLISQGPRPTAYDVTFCVARVPVRVSPWFWLIAAAIQRQPSVPLTVLWVGVVFAAVLIHECGHALAARRFGAPRPQIVLGGTGGLTFSASADSWGKRVLTDLAGVGAGFGTCALVIALRQSVLKHVIASQAGAYLDFFTANLVYVNIVWGCLNLLPILPLDGGQVTKELVCRFRPKKAEPLARKVSVVAAAVAALACVMARQFFGAMLFGYLAWLNAQNLMSPPEIRSRESAPPRKGWEKKPDWWRESDG